MKTQLKIDGCLKTANIDGLDEMPILFYGEAKKNGIKEGDKITVESDFGVDEFGVGSYKQYDSTGRKISSFVLFEEN